LILGGALSFAVFQIVGRGVVGVIATLAVGLTAVALLVRKFESEPDAEPRWWMLGQLVGMGMLAITSEFAELLPVVVTLFVIGFITDSDRHPTRSVKLATAVAGAATAVFFLLLRKEFWWIITDDYLFLEVISRHITSEGPLADWGVTSFAQYHWLSYGWSGLLDLLGGGPESLITLSRVMPLVYSLSMASSLLVITRHLTSVPLVMSTVIPPWAVITVGRFEWTGASTAGVHAVLAAVVALGLIGIASRTSVVRSVLLLALFLGIITLTKAPSVFAFAIAVWTLFIVLVLVKIRSRTLQQVLLGIGVATLLLALFSSIKVFSLVSDRIFFARVNPGLGQLSEFGRAFVTVTLILSQPWLWFAVVWVTWGVVKHQRFVRAPERWTILMTVVSLPVATVLELTLSGSTNTYTYFSDTMFFLSSLSFLLLAESRPSDTESPATRVAYRLLATLLVVSGLVWGSRPFGEVFWGLLSDSTSGSMRLRLELLRFFTSNRITGALIVSLLCLVVGSALKRSIPISKSLLTASVLIGFFGLQPSTTRSFAHDLPSLEVQQVIGAPDAIEVGNWLKENSARGDLVATNHLTGDRSVLDYSLAVWSQREFLVLGPGIGYETTPQSVEAIRISRAFADQPNEMNCAELRELGVDWFIVDKRQTTARDWRVCTNEAFESGNFMVLALRA
jgi:hypothetical protein